MHKKIVTFLITFLYVFSISNSSILLSKINCVKAETSNKIYDILHNDKIDTNDANEIFQMALNEYNSILALYIDITGLNVTNKDAINLNYYDENYVAPEFYNVLYDYQNNLESSLDVGQEAKYNMLRKEYYQFDRFVSLINCKFNDLTPLLKYDHINVNNPLIPITPLYPTLLTSDNQNTIMLADASSSADELIAILVALGLSTEVQLAISSSVSTLTIGLSASAIPFIGWALAVVLIIESLVAISTIIIENWNIIKPKLEEIRNWFLINFAIFSPYINTYFDDVKDNGEETTISSIITINQQEFKFIEVKVDDVETQVYLVTKARRTYDVYLMQYIGQNSFQVALNTPVSVEYCIENITHFGKYSSNTWYQNTARSLIINAGSGYTSKMPELNLKNNDKNPKYAFKHFHNYDAQGKRINKPDDIHRIHSFFGLLYWTENEDGQGAVHPLSPTH